MFGPRINLFRVFGIQIRIDLSWFVLACLITWSLATSFPIWLERFNQPPLPVAAYWWMGGAGALGLFASILLHELGHARVAQAFGVPMRGITLFIFGGVAEMSQEPPSARAEFWVAIAGPIVSVVLSIVLLGVAALPTGLPLPVDAVLTWLGVVNGVLVAFNMLPAFPLDGGRVLRSALWAIRKNLRWATRVTSRIGSGFGIGFIVLGVFSILLGNFIGGLWWAVIGMFLRNAARMSYEQLLMRRALEGEPLERFMRPDVATVPPDITLQELVNEYIYRHHHKMFPVVQDGQVLGCVSTRDLQQTPREQWPIVHVGQVTQACSADNTIDLRADATEALAKMNRTGNSRLLVMDRDGDVGRGMSRTGASRLAGIVTLKDLLRFISLKVELEQGDEPEPSLATLAAPGGSNRFALRSREPAGSRHAEQRSHSDRAEP